MHPLLDLIATFDQDDCAFVAGELEDGWEWAHIGDRNGIDVPMTAGLGKMCDAALRRQTVLSTRLDVVGEAA